MNTEKPICPIQFRDYITYGGNQTFLEVTDQEIPGIVPHTYYCDIYGNIYTRNRDKVKNNWVSNSGYERNEFRLRDGKRYCTGVHRVVSMLFNYFPGCQQLEVNHIYGNKLDNYACHLEWVTPKENMEHAYRTGLNQNYGENNKQTTITNEQVHEICKRLEAGNYTSYIELAKEFNCSPAVIFKIANGKAWTRISSEYDFGNVKKNSRFTKEEIHRMCEIFVQESGSNFKHIVFPKVQAELNLYDDPNAYNKVKKIYAKEPGRFNDITSQYDYNIDDTIYSK